MSVNGSIELWPGSLPVLRLTFKNRDGVLATPSGLSVLVKPPTGVTVTYNYPGAGFTLVSVGVIDFELAITLAGTWKFRVVATGTVAAVLEETVVVNRTDF